jgi:nicotinate-nucleotide pyrophosphorylase (carboxylating)
VNVAVSELVERALDEDVGSGDVTSAATVEEAARARASVTQKAPGVIFGFDLAEEAFRAMDPDVAIERLAEEGRWGDGGEVLRIAGRARAILTAERTALNFLAHLSGIATATARAVREVEGTGVSILDTRKTTPGLRALEKAAVRAGGGSNHRAGLFDAILIKENHAALAGGVGEAVRRARAAAPELSLEVECRSMAEIDEALEAGAGRLLLDNFTPQALREAVARVGGRAQVEASGGITLHALRDFATTGIQWISIGALTHSAPALDLSLTLEEAPR